MANIIILSGSPNRQSRLFGLIAAAQTKLTQAGNQVEVLQVTELPAEDLIHARFDSSPIVQALQKIQQADAIIVASPVYKASYTGILKTFLDLIPERGLANKVLLPLFVGGTLAHLLVIDYALKPVLSALGGQRILTGVYAVDQSIQRLDGGGFQLDSDVQQRVDRAVTALEDELIFVKQVVAAQGK